MVNVKQDELLQYLYKECSPEKTIEIQQELETNAELRERLNVLKSAKVRLDKIKLISPDARSVDSIFNYSKPRVEILT
jgi:hypothetical protein